MNNLDPREQKDPNNQNGKPPYPETLFVSSERSGLNLVRHVIESLSSQRTPGKQHLIDSGKLLFHRTHCVHTTLEGPGRTNLYNYHNIPKYAKIILLLRDPREIYVRAFDKSVDRVLSYCWNINAYDRFKGQKLLVYYDDLILNNNAFKMIFDFLGIGNTFDETKLEIIRKESLDWYDIHQSEKGKGSITKGAPEKLMFHQLSLDENELNCLLTILKTELGPRYSYLSKWGL
jgi:hypothetical protein